MHSFCSSVFSKLTSQKQFPSLGSINPNTQLLYPCARLKQISKYNFFKKSASVIRKNICCLVGSKDLTYTEFDYVEVIFVNYIITLLKPPLLRHF